MINISSKWEKIKAEYISGDISYRQLAKKHGVSFATLSAKAKKESWCECRKQAQDKATTEIIQKTANVVSESANIAEELKLKLLQRLKRIESKYPLDATEVRVRQQGKIVIFRLKDLTAAYKDIIDNMPIEENTTTIDKLDKLLEVAWNAAYTETK